MKRVLLLLTMTLANYLVLSAQTDDSCTPDLEALDSIAFIVPPPLGELTPNGGIKDSAYVGVPFEYTFSVLVPDTAVNFGGLAVVVLKISFSPDTSITYDPPLANFDYVCDPPECEFVSSEPGCVKIFGTATENEIGVHELLFTGEAYTELFPSFPIPVNFPDPDFFPGSYHLVVKEDISASANDLFASNFSIVNRPNPFSDLTQIHIQSNLSGTFEFRVHDMLGQTLHREVVNLLEGENTFDFDGGHLANGMYLYSLSDGKHVATKKMIVNRR